MHAATMRKEHPLGTLEHPAVRTHQQKDTEHILVSKFQLVSWFLAFVKSRFNIESTVVDLRKSLFIAFADNI